MDTVDLSKLWLHVAVLEAELKHASLAPEVVPHEETDLHRVFCDDTFCLERSATTE
jgi:hypothetical protein